ncbi:MAG TPA: hypothetical protein VE086_04205, partial [Chthoniobacterales bacterium]|nr:hypothetical protein [Chthoniobacterales bacterium]
GQREFFGDTWDINIKFVAPLGEIPKEFQVSDAKEEKKPTSKSNDQPSTKDAAGDDDDDNVAAQPKGGELKVKELVLTTDASEVEYKKMVEHILFKSKSNVKSVCSELAANLKGQGWTNDGPDMIQPQSSILKRKRGGATLTIFVKPANGGSEVQMFTEGLSWEGE